MATLDLHVTLADIANIPRGQSYSEKVLMCRVDRVFPSREREFQPGRVFNLRGKLLDGDHKESREDAYVHLYFIGNWAFTASFIEVNDIVSLKGFVVQNVPSIGNEKVEFSFFVSPSSDSSTLRVLQLGIQDDIMEVMVRSDEIDNPCVRVLPRRLLAPFIANDPLVFIIDHSYTNMSLKIWVKRAGVCDAEALGIRVQADGTAQSVLVACSEVFRDLLPSRVSLQTENGIVVSLSTPAAALRNHTLELIQQPPPPPLQNSVQSPRSVRKLNALPMETTNPQHPIHAKTAVYHRGLARSASSKQHPSPQRLHDTTVPRKRTCIHTQSETTTRMERKRRGELIKVVKKGTAKINNVDTTCVSISDMLSFLWESLPVFTPGPLMENPMSVTKTIQDARIAFLKGASAYNELPNPGTRAPSSPSEGCHETIQGHSTLTDAFIVPHVSGGDGGGSGGKEHQAENIFREERNDNCDHALREEQCNHVAGRENDSVEERTEKSISPKREKELLDGVVLVLTEEKMLEDVKTERMPEEPKNNSVEEVMRELWYDERLPEHASEPLRTVMTSDFSREDLINNKVSISSFQPLAGGFSESGDGSALALEANKAEGVTTDVVSVNSVAAYFEEW